MDALTKALSDENEVLKFELNETARSFSTLIEILANISSAKNLVSMFEGVLTILNNHFKFDKSLFVIQKSDEYRVLASSGFDEGFKFKEPKRTPDSLAWCAQEIKSFLIVKELCSDERFDQNEFFEQTHPISTIVTHLEHGKVSGVFMFYLSPNSIGALRTLSNSLDMLLSVLGPYLGGFVSSLEIEKEKKEIEARLIQNGKLASIGTMSAGIAHELNNPLFSIMTYAGLIVEKPEGPKTTLYAEKIVKTAERMKGIITHLLSFSRESAHFDYTDIRESILQAHALFEQRLREENIAINLSFADANPMLCWGDRVKLESVFQNLIGNSRDAFESVTNGRKKQISLDAKTDEAGTRIIYSDNAGGMTQEVQNRIFDPFFTTKPVGKGTGLGMNIVFMIIKQHLGEISLSSTLGE
ncbi:ATP-binding protein [Bdellovibrionota bacterium FG-2]